MSMFVHLMDKGVHVLGQPENPLKQLTNKSCYQVDIV